jgi:hypothetical protein
MWSIGLVILQIRFIINYKELAKFMESLGIISNKTVADRQKQVNMMFTELTKKWTCMLILYYF